MDIVQKNHLLILQSFHRLELMTMGKYIDVGGDHFEAFIQDGTLSGVDNIKTLSVSDLWLDAEAKKKRPLIIELAGGDTITVKCGDFVCEFSDGRIATKTQLEMLTGARHASLASLEYVPSNTLTPFQGNLKDLSVKNFKRLKGQLLENGIIVPFYVWENEGALYLLDGHQRDRVFQAEGWDFDVPIIRFQATDRVEAKKKLLAISSQYGHVTQEGWDEFTFGIEEGWTLENVYFDALPFVFGDFANEDDFDPESVDFKEYDETTADDVQYCTCPKCGHEFPK
jgi:hypothetical protein